MQMSNAPIWQIIRIYTLVTSTTRTKNKKTKKQNTQRTDRIPTTQLLNILCVVIFKTVTLFILAQPVFGCAAQQSLKYLSISLYLSPWRRDEWKDWRSRVPWRLMKVRIFIRKLGMRKYMYLFINWYGNFEYRHLNGENKNEPSACSCTVFS